MMMLSQMRGRWIEDQRRATVSVDFGKSSVNDDSLARIFEGALTLLDYDQYVAIDNHVNAAIDPKLRQHFLTELWCVDEHEIGIFRDRLMA
jgi:hypothetical protein